MSIFFSCGLFAQERNIYDPTANANEQIEQAIAQARSNNKHVLIQVGGNWCPWCIKLHNYYSEHPQIDSIIAADYELIYLNYSKENKNLDALAKLGYPQRFGFPVLLILDANGTRLHTQDTGLLEEENGYSEKKLKSFLLNWNASALSSEMYRP